MLLIGGGLSHPHLKYEEPLMVSGTRQAFNALRSSGNAEIPRNLRVLYHLPNSVVIAYWRRVLASPRGELWFGPTAPVQAGGGAGVGGQDDAAHRQTQALVAEPGGPR